MERGQRIEGGLPGIRSFSESMSKQPESPQSGDPEQSGASVQKFGSREVQKFWPLRVL